MFLLEWSQYLSDVGGAAGLVLGMSAATILGIFDRLFLSIIGWKSKTENPFRITHNKVRFSVKTEPSCLE